MPVAPAFAAIGTAMGASAATATAVGVATTATVASVGVQAYSMVQQNKAAKASANLVKEGAEYNAAVDMADAKQIELDMDANTRAERRDAAVYTSRQRAAYAAAGVLNTGSPLAVQVESAGRMEQAIQQERINAGREITKRESAAKLGILYGNAQADAIKRQNKIDMLKGGIGILKTVAGAYDQGVFSSLGSKLSAPKTPGMLAAGFGGY